MIWGRIWPVIGAVAAALCLGIAAYGMAGLAGGALPVNRHWTAPERGIRIYIEDNGIHTGIVMPVVAAGVDWRAILRPDALADPRYAGHAYVSFGWGDRDFYLDTPHWSDLSVATVLHAAMGSDDVVMHVDHLPRPTLDARTRSVVLRPAEYRQLAAFIRDGFALDGDGRASGRPGYAAWDAFYIARGHYSARHTCNDWAGEAFRQAGVRMGAWTPFSASVLSWF